MSPKTSTGQSNFGYIVVVIVVIVLGSILWNSLQNNDTTDTSKPTSTTQSAGTIQSPTEKARAYLASQSRNCLTADEAWNYIGATTCVRFIVQHIYRSQGGTVFLNAEINEQDFSVVSFYGNPITYSDAQYYLGGYISVRGEIAKYDGQPQIIVDDKADVFDVVTAAEREQQQQQWMDEFEEYAKERQQELNQWRQETEKYHWQLQQQMNAGR